MVEFVAAAHFSLSKAPRPLPVSCSVINLLFCGEGVTLFERKNHTK